MAVELEQEKLKEVLGSAAGEASRNLGTSRHISADLGLVGVLSADLSQTSV